MNLSPLPIQKFFANNGRPLDGGLLFTYAAGTSTKIATYTDSGGLSSNTNPIVLDFRGECRIWIDPSLTYKFVLAPPGDTDPPTNPIWTVDNISIFGDSGASVIGKLIWPLTAAEIAAGFNDSTIDYVGPQGFLPRYKIVASDPTKATQNTLAMQSLFDPLVEDGPVGQFWFPNNGGGEVYYFNDHVEVRPGVYIDCGGATLNFTKEYDAADDFKGFLMAIRDFEIKNGTISYTMTSAPAGKNLCAFRFGSRTGYAFGQWPAGIYDQTDLIDEGLPPMGNIAVRDMRIDCDNPGYAAIFAFGGLENVEIDQVVVDGMSSTIYFIYYEFGYSSTNANPLDEYWTSSHANNLRITNIKARNFTDTSGEGDVIHLAGAYSATLENIDGQDVYQLITCRPGEALYYRMWDYNTPGGGKRCINLKNITGRGLVGTAIGLIGSELATGYLNPIISALTTAQQAAATTNLMQYSLDGFAVQTDGFGIVVSGKSEVSNGVTQACASGIRVVGTCSEFFIHDCDVLDSTAAGIRADEASNISPITFKKQGRILGCKVAGSAGAGISLNWTQGVQIEGCQLGYNTDKFDAANEATQTNGVICAADADGVTVKDNFVTTSGGAVAYQKTSGPDGCVYISGYNTKTLGGLWLAGGLTVQNNLNFAAPTNIDCSNGMIVNLNVNGGGAFTISAPTNIQIGVLTICVQNTSGGVIGAITWNAVFKLAGAFTNPANGQQRSISFQYDGSVLHEIARNAADVPI